MEYLENSLVVIRVAGYMICTITMTVQGVQRRSIYRAQRFIKGGLFMLALLGEAGHPVLGITYPWVGFMVLVTVMVVCLAILSFYVTLQELRSLRGFLITQENRGWLEQLLDIDNPGTGEFSEGGEHER